MPRGILFGSGRAAFGIYSLGSDDPPIDGADPQQQPVLIFDFQKNPAASDQSHSCRTRMERILMRSSSTMPITVFRPPRRLSRVLTEHLENLKRGAVTRRFGNTGGRSLRTRPFSLGFCGQRIIATDLFCTFCGSKNSQSPSRGPCGDLPARGLGRGRAYGKLVIEGTSELDAPVLR